MYHLTSCEQEWFVLSSVLKAFEKFGFKVPAHAITQSADLLEVMSLCSCLFFFSTYSVFFFFLCSAFLGSGAQ